jgi:hypothetical protein
VFDCKGLRVRTILGVCRQRKNSLPLDSCHPLQTPALHDPLLCSSWQSIRSRSDLTVTKRATWPFVQGLRHPPLSKPTSKISSLKLLLSSTSRSRNSVTQSWDLPLHLLPHHPTPTAHCSACQFVQADELPTCQDSIHQRQISRNSKSTSTLLTSHTQEYNEAAQSREFKELVTNTEHTMDTTTEEFHQTDKDETQHRHQSSSTRNSLVIDGLVALYSNNGRDTAMKDLIRQMDQMREWYRLIIKEYKDIKASHKQIFKCTL